jgi:hypothetical protein
MTNSTFNISMACQKGTVATDSNETKRPRELQGQITAEKGIRADTFCRPRFFRLAARRDEAKNAAV